MKSSVRIFLISFLATISLIICSCDGGNGNHDHEHSDDTHGIIVEPNNKLVSMKVPQIPCESCQAKVEAALKSDAGIVRYKVFKTSEHEQNVLVVYDPNKITVDQITALITKLGKTVENVTEK